MKFFISPEQIAEMKARGDDAKTLGEAEEQLARQRRAMELIRRIEVAFAGVTLGAGVGLREGDAMDDWENEETCAQRRLDDEKDDWRRITDDELCRFASSPSYFDAEGMRFHLPALLIAELKGEYPYGMEFHLTYKEEHGRNKFSLLNAAQRQVVREYLNLLLEDPDEINDHQEILEDLYGFWAENPA
jgi:hypothetical protein